MNDNAQNKQPINTPEDNVNIPVVSIQPITQQELSGLKYTGITAKIKLPLELDSGDFLFAINTDGFIPPVNLKAKDMNAFNRIYPNLLPIQPSQSAHSIIQLDHKFLPTYEQCQYLSNRFMQGSVGVVVRLVSNVGQTGHLAVTHLTGIQRDYYLPSEEYQGLRFRNMPTDTFAGSLAGLTLVDISTNRNLSLISTNNPATNVLDFNKKLCEIASFTASQTTREKEIMESQFLEDWLLFGPTNSMPNTGGETFELSFYFDYSRVTFFIPLYPVIPTVLQERAKQILQFSKTYVEDVEIGDIAESDIQWLPGYSSEPFDKQKKLAVDYIAKLVAKN